MAEVLNFFFKNKEFKKSKFSSEDEFEKDIIKNSKIFFKDYYVFEWKFKINTPSYDPNVIPDICMIKKDFSMWLVVEVELEKHSFNGHILPQIKSLEKGTNYNSDDCYQSILNKMKKKIESNAHEKLKYLILFNEPKFLVIADKRNILWKNQISILNFMYLSIERYINFENEFAYSLSDDSPDYWKYSKSICVYNDFKELKITNPNLFGYNFFEKDKVYEIYHQGKILKFIVFKSQNLFILRPLNDDAHDLKRKKYDIKVYENGKIEII